MKANVFSRELEDGSVELTCTVVNPPIVVAAPTERMACDALVRALHDRGIYNLKAVEAEEEAP